MQCQIPPWLHPAWQRALAFRIIQGQPRHCVVLKVKPSTPKAKAPDLRAVHRTRKKAAQSQLGIPTKREKERHRKRFFQKQKQPLATFGLGFTRLDSETQTKLPCVLAGIRHPLPLPENARKPLEDARAFVPAAWIAGVLRHLPVKR